VVDPLTVTVLGSAATFPRPDRPCSGYLVRTATTKIWVDAGSGTFAALQALELLGDIDAIVLSHEHPDHWLELPVVRNAAKYILGVDRLPVYGTAGTRALAETMIGDLDAPIAWTDITDGDELRIGDVAIRLAVTDHPVETLAMRFDAGGRTAAYSADTGADWSFAALDPGGDGFDLAFCEASMPEAQAGRFQHLTASQAGAMSRAAGVRRLVLTHLSSDPVRSILDPAQGPHGFDGPVELAQPRKVYAA
jgi:ribonuclease BN (tRNA processing enzyme)